MQHARAVADEKLSLYRSKDVAARYDERWLGARGQARDRRKQRALLRALALLGNARSVLDVPCGTGRFTSYLRARGLSYLGVDAAPAMLGEARAKSPDARFVAGDLTQLPLADQCVDIALCIRLMHLVRDPALRAAFLRELARVSRIGVIVDFRSNRSLRVWLGAARARIGLRSKAPGALSFEVIRTEIEAAGLELRAFLPVRRVPLLSDKVVVVAVKRAPTA